MSPLRAGTILLFLAYIVAVYVVVVSGVLLYFGIIDTAFFTGDKRLLLLFKGDGFRFYLATLLIITPLLAWLGWRVGSVVRSTPLRKSRLYQWAFGISLLLSAAVVVSEGVLLLYRFLRADELPMPFLLKLGGTLLLFGALAAFFYYSYHGTHASLRRILRFGFLGALTVLIVAGFMINGTPASVRTLSEDLQRIDDLEAIASTLVFYYQETGTLPESLASLSEPPVSFTVPTDPKTGAPYRYTRTAKNTYIICATFAEAFPKLPQKGQGLSWRIDELIAKKQRFDHGVGDTCFERTVPKSKRGVPPLPVPLKLR